MRNEDINKFGRDTYEAIESIFSEEELRQQRIEEQIEEATRRRKFKRLRSIMLIEGFLILKGMRGLFYPKKLRILMLRLT